MRWPVLLLIALPSTALAADPSNYLTELQNLGPGDTLRLDPGTYMDCMRITDMHGTPAAPIVITGPASGPPAIFTADNCREAQVFEAAQIKLLRSSYIVIRNLELDGQGHAVDGIEGTYCDLNSESVHHITIENVFFHDHSASSGVNAVSTKCNAWDWVIRNNRMIRSGLGLYLGDSPGDAPFIRGTIEYNFIEDTRGYGMQIKHQIPRPNITDMPQGNSITYIRHNVFTKRANGVQGNLSRPNLLVGHFPPAGAGEGDRYEIYGNFFYDNDSDQALFQGEGNISFHDNIMVNTFQGGAIRIQPHNDVPKEVAVFHNTVISNGVGISVTGGANGFDQRVLANAVFAPEPIVAQTALGNITDSIANAGMYVNNPSTVLRQMDLYPLAGQLVGQNVDLSAYANHQDVNLDFNGHNRPGTYRGAYAGQGANPGWTLAAASKPAPMMRPPDAGVATDAGPADSGAAPADVGFADAGFMDTNVGFDVVAMDAVVAPDAQVFDDATTAPDDAGVVASDAGFAAADTNVSAEGPAASGGCGCSTGESRAGSIWIAGLSLLLLCRRRCRS